MVSYVPGPTPVYNQQGAVPSEASMHQMMPGPGQSLLDGMPDPDAIEQQRRAYEKGLDAEFEATKKIAEEQLKQQKAALKAQADQQLAMYKAQMEQALRQHEMSLDQAHQQSQMELQQAFMKQKAALEQQATSLTMEYQQRKMQEDLMQKQAEMQKEMAEMQRRMHQEMSEHQNQQLRMQHEHADARQKHHEELAFQQAELMKQHAAFQDPLQRSASQLPVYAAPQTAMMTQGASPTMYAPASPGGAVHQPMVYQAAPGTHYMPPVPAYPGYAQVMTMPQAETQPMLMEPQSAAGMAMQPTEATSCGFCGEVPAARYSYAPIVAQYAQPLNPAES